MSPVRGIACLALLAPLAVWAQVSESRARIEPPRLHVCAVEHASITDRKAYLDMDKAAIDRERSAIDREGERLAAGLRSLDTRDTAAVEAHNARLAEHNQRVAVHNGYVDEMNRAVVLLTGDGTAFNTHCSTLRFSRR